MKWYTIEWFGGVKTECEECHHYAVGNSEREARAYMRARLTDYWCPYCITCHREKEIVDKNDPDYSYSQLPTEVKKLRQSLTEWKDAWFQLREIIGNLWWHHPAIDNDEQRRYYQANLRHIESLKPKGNDVYIDGKLVGSGTSPDAAAAIKRLMSF